MNIEANLKKLKTSIKRRKKITLTLMLGFLMTGVIGYADDPTPTVQELQKKIIELEKQIQEKNKEIEGKNKEIEGKNKEIEGKNKEIKNRFESKAVIAGKGAKIGGKDVPDDKTIRGIAIGEEATIDEKDNNEGHYSIAIGRKARIESSKDPYRAELSGIALGDNAHVSNGNGRQEKALSFMKDNYDKNKLPGGIAIGTNTYARTGSIQMGSHTYSGLMGGIDINDKTNREASIVNMTTIGTNSYQKAAMGTMVGAYNISTGTFGTGSGTSLYGGQNFGSSVFGTLNSIRSNGKNYNSGVANSIVGIANITENANGSLVFGAGNVIKNSNEKLSSLSTFIGSLKNVDEAAKKFRDAISENKAGGATLAIGGANKADYTKQVSMIGTRNEVKGIEGKKTELVSITGDNNLVEKSRNSINGNNFHVTGEGNILQGFNNVNSNERRKVTNKNVVALGNDIKVSTDDSVYLGKESANSKEENTLWREKNKRDKAYQAYKEYAGFDHIGGIVSVGNDTLTRVIQNVAPGLISPTSTDAINGSQLYNYVAKQLAKQYITVKDGKGGETKVKLGDTITLKGTTVNVTVKAPDKTSTTSASTSTLASTSTSQSAQQAPAPEPKPQEHTVTYERDTFEYKLRDEKTHKDTTLIEGADGKLYTQDFLDKNEYKNNKWVKKGTDTDSENISENQHKKTDGNVILSTKYNKIISGVADGTEKNDAVNLGQLDVVKKDVKTNADNIEKLQGRVTEVEKKSDLALSGVSNAVAMANLPQVMGDKKFNLAASYGYYGGSHALAIGFSGTNDKQNFIYKLSGSVNNKGNLAFGIGAGVMLGEVNNKDKKIENLTKENKEIKENLRNQSVEIQELKEIVRRLMKK